MNDLLLPPENAGMPWSRLVEAGWKILHVHHHRPGQLTAYIESDKEFLLQKGPDTPDFWTRLEVKAGIESKKALPKKVATIADPRQAPFVNEWHHAYKAHFGRPYLFQGAQDGGQLKKFLQATDKTIEEIMNVAREAWATSEKKFAQATKRAVTISGFCTGWNEINAELDRLLAEPPQR